MESTRRRVDGLYIPRMYENGSMQSCDELLAQPWVWSYSYCLLMHG